MKKEVCGGQFHLHTEGRLRELLNRLLQVDLFIRAVW